MIDARQEDVKELELLDINLQLFADSDDEDVDYDLDDEDFEDEDLEDDSELDDDDSYNDDEDPPESDEADADGDADKSLKKRTEKEADAKPKAKDKVTHALIKQKQANRDLKAKLDLLEKKDREAEQQSRKKFLVDKLVDKGYDEDEALIEAEKQLDNEAIRNTVKKLEFMTENADVLAKYPQAKKNVDKLLKLQKATGWSIDKICRVEYATTENAFDSKVKSDLESRLKQKKRPSSTPAGGQTPTQSLKLDPEDEKAYQFYSKKHPGVSRKQYITNLNQASSQKIPHDKWD